MSSVAMLESFIAFLEANAGGEKRLTALHPLDVIHEIVKACAGCPC